MSQITITLSIDEARRIVSALQLKMSVEHRNMDRAEIAGQFGASISWMNEYKKTEAVLNEVADQIIPQEVNA